MILKRLTGEGYELCLRVYTEIHGYFLRNGRFNQTHNSTLKET